MQLEAADWSIQATPPVHLQGFTPTCVQYWKAANTGGCDCPSTRSRCPIPAPTVPTRPRHGHFLRPSSRGARRIPPGLRPPVPGGRESLPERPARRHGIHARLPGLGLGHRYTGPHHGCWQSSPRRRPTWVREASSTPACWTGPCSLRRLRCVPAGSCGVRSPPPAGVAGRADRSASTRIWCLFRYPRRLQVRAG